MQENLDFVKLPRLEHTSYLSDYYFRISIIGISFILSIITFLYQAKWKENIEYGDASGYLFGAHHLYALLKGGGRTYGYPLFLKIPVLLSEYFNINFSVVCIQILIIQFCLYTTCTLYFAASVTNKRSIQNIIVAGLMLNILFLPLLSLTLTESVSISISIFCFSVFCRNFNFFIKCFLLGIVSAFLIEIRPANLWFFAFIFFMLFLDLFDKKYSKKEIFYCIGLFLLGSLISFMPQLIINYFNFHQITPFPAVNLGMLQMQAGKDILHVSFITSNIGLKPISALIIPNPFKLISTNFHWLSINGFAYLILKLLSIILHDDLFVYQSVSSLMEKIVIFFSCFCVFFGISGLYFQRKQIGIKYSRAIILAIILCILLHLPTQLEDRFTLPIFIILFPLGIYQFASWFKAQDYKKFILFLLYFIFMYTIYIMFLIMSEYFEMIRHNI